MDRTFAMTFSAISVTVAEVVAALRGRAGDLLDGEGSGDAATAGRVERVLDRDVVVDDDAGRLRALGLDELHGRLEVEDVAGVVLDDREHARAGVGAEDRRDDLVGGGGREHGARDCGVEHALPDEAGVQRLVARSPAADEPDLAGDGSADARHVDRCTVHLDEIGMSGSNPSSDSMTAFSGSLSNFFIAHPSVCLLQPALRELRTQAAEAHLLAPSNTPRGPRTWRSGALAEYVCNRPRMDRWVRRLSPARAGCARPRR